MAGTYPKKNTFVTDDCKINIFFKRKIFNSIIVILFSLIITSTTLAQSTSAVSCNQTTNINQFQASLTAYAKTIKKKNA